MLKKEFNINKKSLLIGTSLITLGIAAPLFINVYNFRIYEIAQRSLQENNQGLLMIAVIRLVLLNSIRGLPHYLGTFIIAESIDIKINGKNIYSINGLVAIIIIPSVYSAINIIHNIKYDLGVPAFIVIFAIIYLEKMDYTKVSFFKKSIIITLLLLGAQWLDVIPHLSSFGFGRGETSRDIKTIANIIDGTEILFVSASLYFSLFTFTSILVAKLINDENKLIMTTERNQKIEKELYETRMEFLEIRNDIELRHLVHDLKSPLTAIQALTSVIDLMENDIKIKSYLAKVDDSIDNLSELISEILYEDKKNMVSMEELFNYILSQISHLPFNENIEYINNAEDVYVNVNKIRFSRAIINALDNSYNALKSNTQKIFMMVDLKNKNTIIEIKDNGIGIQEEILDEVIKKGYSTRKSTGLGLSFIKEVVKSHGGEIYLDSTYKVGTSLIIKLPKGDINE